ncbi:penicillin-binding protein PBP2B [Streptococcus pseudoporcinus]|uniref:Penicillin-binding protein, transpeptidase domain protein n=1 Tax=Streptococcus pseudoporcinus TaxID=361101 RepID=A0A4U9XJX4_9STRE|nr:penicillin-binding protein PBP2B [Streptococcus pseudoporcinus]VTS12778.1 penicillin-binding protein, transpeptidase domain protein [Streptococcus pseudoporcinus]VUC65600.1 penicillin-binding protein, transpeptidase domain protein [Streptococcus pseudoporcinus]VUC96521.1 penicillin-binding protein, transpeptidase domain protein [Streptococcus pseudoporcinus]VUC96912.1 penicillin-binding protein, transpeptidase domain protein [Streptococcus pseudoporcinus]
MRSLKGGIVIKKESQLVVKKKASIPRRINLLFSIIVFLFVALILRLAQMQIQDKAFYDAKLKSSTVYKVKSSTPRGMIFDQKGKLLVGNDVKEVISFTRNPDASANDLRTLAKKLAAYARYNDVKISLRAKKDYYLADPKVYAQVVKKLPKNKKVDTYGNSLTEEKIYRNAVASVTKENLNYSPEEEKVISIFNQMNAAANFNTITLRTADLTDQEIAYLVANKSKLPGISVTTDWNRKVEDVSLNSIIGKVSSREAGLPQEEVAEYIKKGYALNDRVGTSYLERQYENQLQGQHEVREIKTNKSGKIVSDKITHKGEIGKNLKLTIATDFQDGVDKIIRKYFESEVALGKAKYSEGAYAVAMNPKTGAILAMSGLSQDLETGQLEKNALGTITNVFTPGSVVKGATLAAGWQTGAITGNQVLTDQPIQFGNSKPINSWFTFGQQNISAIQALEYSSNTYMVQVALKMMGQDYHVGMSLTSDGMKKTMEELRQTYASFGLGAPTGIDLPGESTGYVASKYTVSNVITEAFGQFDNYTAMQLAQYVSTIANGGKRLAPHLVEGVYRNDGSKGLGQLEKTIARKELNQVQLNKEQLSIIQDGFYQVVNSGSPYATGKDMAGSAVTISGKTGTAETYAKDKNGNTVVTFNLNVVAYGPSQDPQIAVAIMYPHASDALAKAHQYMAKDIINLYLSMNAKP